MEDNPKWVFPKIGGKPPKWMVKILENLIKHGMIWGVFPLFSVQHPNDQVLREFCKHSSSTPKLSSTPRIHFTSKSAYRMRGEAGGSLSNQRLKKQLDVDAYLKIR